VSGFTDGDLRDRRLYRASGPGDGQKPFIAKAHRTFRETQDSRQASAAFLALVDKGSIGLKAAMAGTPYA